jgi:ABC-type glycerol-3-phosphate transport system substrate-binding protein
MEEKKDTKTLLNRRQFLKMAGMMGSAALLTACGTKATEAPTQAPQAEAPTVEATSPAAEQVTISWWNQFSTPTCQEVFPKVVQDFEAQNPNIKVEFEITGGPPGGGDYFEVLLARIAAGNSPDSITLWTPPSEFGAQGALTTIDSYMDSAKLAKKDAFYTGPMQSCQLKGQTFGLPASAGSGSMFFNKAHFEEAGLSTNRDDFPKTWDEIKAVATKLTKKDDTGMVSNAGFVPWTQRWLDPVWSGLNGGLVFDPENLKYMINTENNIEVANYWLSYLDDLYGGDIEAFNVISSWGDVYPNTAFNLGVASIDMSGAWAPTDAAIPFEFEIAKFPVGPKGSKSVTGFWPNWWAIPKGTPHPNEGFLFSEYMCTEGWITWYINGTMDTPAWKGAPADIWCKAVETMFGLERAKDFHQFYTDYLNDTAVMWASPVEDFAQTTIGQSIDEILHKTKTPEQALNEAQDLCQQKLDETMQSS